MKKMLYLLLVLFVAGCAGGGQTVKKDEVPASEKTAAPDFDAMIARESTGLAMTESGGDLKISLLSAAPAQAGITSTEKPAQYEISIPIGASINADCYITEEAAFPSVVLKNVFDSIGALPTIEMHRIKEIKSGVLQNVPYIYLEAEYITKDKLYGIAKMIASSTMDASFYCSHDELGYRNSFLGAVESLAKSDYIQGFVQEMSHYRKKQIDVMYLNDMSVGYSEHYQIDLEGEDRRDISFSSTLIARGPNTIFTNDSVDYTTYNNKTGHILSGEYYSYTNDAPDYELTLEKEGDRNYSVTGAFQGKEVKEIFKANKNLIYSGYIVDLYIHDKTTKENWDFDEYVPLSPLGSTKSTITLKEKRDDGSKTIEYSFSGARATVELDSQSYSQMDMAFGNAAFKMVREFLDIKQ